MLFWQKKEVLVTFSLNDFNRVRIFWLQIISRMTGRLYRPAAAGAAGRWGTAFMDESVLRQLLSLCVEKGV